MDKIETFLFGAIAGAVALGVTAFLVDGLDQVCGDDDNSKPDTQTGTDNAAQESYSDEANTVPQSETDVMV